MLEAPDHNNADCRYKEPDDEVCAFLFVLQEFQYVKNYSGHNLALKAGAIKLLEAAGQMAS